jgi:E1A/CREB-binding protein
LTNHPSLAERDAQNKEARQQRVLQVQYIFSVLFYTFDSYLENTIACSR